MSTDGGRSGQKFHKEAILSIAGQEDVDYSLDVALEIVEGHWEENLRRLDLGARKQARLRVAHRVVTALRHQDFRAALPSVTAAGERPVVIALPDDRMGTVFDHLRELRGPVNLFVQTDPGFALVLLKPAKRPEAREVPPDVCPIHGYPRLDAAHVLEGDRLITYHRVASDCTFELVDDGAAPVLTP